MLDSLRSIKFIKLGLRLLKFIKFMIYTSHDCRSRDPANLTNFTNLHHFMNLINSFIMAIFQSNLFDKTSNSVGNVTMCQYKKKTWPRARFSAKRRNNHPHNGCNKYDSPRCPSYPFAFATRCKRASGDNRSQRPVPPSSEQTHTPWK